jgi:hypothetical protein
MRRLKFFGVLNRVTWQAAEEEPSAEKCVDTPRKSAFP